MTPNQDKLSFPAEGKQLQPLHWWNLIFREHVNGLLHEPRVPHVVFQESFDLFTKSAMMLTTDSPGYPWTCCHAQTRSLLIDSLLKSLSTMREY